MAKSGMGSHQSTKMVQDEWLTPIKYIHALGEFDLDPCSPINRPWDTAKEHYNINDDGLFLPWFGRVWMNPPYGMQLQYWLNKLALHGNGIALTFARTDTHAFHNYVFPFADSIFFLKRRIDFLDVHGNPGAASSGAPSVFIAYGEENVEALEHSGFRGKHLFINTTQFVVVGITHTWKSIISVAFNRIGSEATLNQVYKVIEQIAPEKISKNKHYKEKIRQTLQHHFSRVRKGCYTVNID